MTTHASDAPHRAPGTTAPAAPSSPHGWFIVSQVKANRVVYFTDDPAYRPPTEGDWYFVTHHLGELPKEMNLRNCWGWRFNGAVFTDVREPECENARYTLIESNRRALLALLCDKIDRVRADWLPACRMGEELRRRKLQEAREFQAVGARHDPGIDAFALLRSVAVRRRATMSDAAQWLVDRDRDMQRSLAATERLRDEFAGEIEHAMTQQDLILLRQQLLENVLPALSKQLPHPAAPMKPEDLEAPLPEVHRVHEIARLNAQLRQAINARRASVHSAYLEDHALLRHKGKLAQAVLDGSAESTEVALLDNFARARCLSLVDAARLILGTLHEAEKTLLNTEMLKDHLMAQIQGISNLRDVRRVEAEVNAVSRRTRSQIHDKEEDHAAGL